MNEIFSLVSEWLTDLLVLGTALLVVSLLLLVFLRQPAARMGVARGALLGLAMLCVLTALPMWPRRTLAELFTRPDVGTADETAKPLVPIANIVSQPLAAGELPATSDESVAVSASLAVSFARLVRLLPLAWLGGAGLASAYILVGAWRAMRLIRTAVQAPAWSQQELELIVTKKNHPPRLKTSERIATAAALLAWRPHILLSAGCVREENRAAIRAALAHEWAHIRHGDLWLLALERLLLPVFCLHPLFWLLRRQIRIDQELLADAAAAGEARVEYAEALVNWAKGEKSPAAPRFVAALSLWEHPSSISRRVQMLLHSRSPVSACGSRVVKWLAPLALLAAVSGLSLVTLRPEAIAQEGSAADAYTQLQPKVKKAKKEKNKKATAKREAAAADKAGTSQPPEAQAFLQILIGQVDHEALSKAESSLGDLVQAASEDQCRLEGNLIVAELTPEKVEGLTVELKKMNSLSILSRPSLVTLNGQQARLQVGGQVPLVKKEETVNGEVQRRIEYQDIGELLLICPQVSEKNPNRLTLELEFSHSELDKQAELRSGHDTPRFITSKFKLEAEATVGKTLIITEREPNTRSGRMKTILLAVTPQKVILSAPISAAGPEATRASVDANDAVLKLRDENAALRKQVDDLRAKLIDLEVQIRWLRAAAAPGGDEKVTDQEFLRRVYLDLTGLIPTVDETKAFLNDKDPRKRDKLIDKLLAEQGARKEESSGWIKWKDALKAESKAKPTTAKSTTPSSEDAAAVLKIVRLSHSQAESTARLLEKVMGKSESRLAVAVDERTNSLVLRGSPESLQLAIALIEALDSEIDSKPNLKLDPKRDAQEASPEDNGASLQKLREADLRSAEAALNAAEAQYDRIDLLRKEEAVSDAEVDKALLRRTHARLVLEATKSGKVTVNLRELEIQEAKLALQAAERNYDSAARLLAKEVISQQQLDEFKSAVERQQAVLEQAKVRLDAARKVEKTKP